MKEVNFVLTQYNIDLIYKAAPEAGINVNQLRSTDEEDKTLETIASL